MILSHHLARTLIKIIDRPDVERAGIEF